jgi:hypothetical protein
MTSECEHAYRKTNKLIEQRKTKLGSSIQPEIQNLDSGILLQYYENWINSVDIANNIEEFSSKKRPINIIDNDENLKEIYLSFGQKHTVENYLVTDDKLLIMLDGHIIINVVGTDEVIDINSFSAKILKGNTIVNITGLDDVNYFVIVRFKSPL